MSLLGLLGKFWALRLHLVLSTAMLLGKFWALRLYLVLSTAMLRTDSGKSIVREILLAMHPIAI